MRKLTGTVLTMLLSISLLAGCGSKETANTDNKVTGEATPAVTSTEKDNDDPVDDPVNPTAEPDEGGIGEKKPVLGDLDAEDLPIFPEDNKAPSMYYYNAAELTNETFYPDQEENTIAGVPYVFNGTVMEEMDSITEYLDLNEHGKVINGLDVSAKAFKVMTKFGQVILIDVSPYQVKFLNDNANKDVYTIKFFKAMYNQLTAYKTFPDTGDTVKFYGFYYGFSEADQCPVFTYGVSNLVRVDNFPPEYDKYRTDNTRHYKFRNLVEFDYPAGWSDPYEDGGRTYFISADNYSQIAITDYDMDGRTVEEVMDMFLNPYPMEGEDVPEGAEDFNIPEIEVIEKEKILVGKDKDISSYKLHVSIKYRDGYMHEKLYAFQAKHSIMLIEIYENNGDQDAPENTDPDAEQVKEPTAFAKDVEVFINNMKLCGI